MEVIFVKFVAKKNRDKIYVVFFSVFPLHQRKTSSIVGTMCRANNDFFAF